MFSRWFKKNERAETQGVQDLAKKLGIERRLNVRVRSPLVPLDLLPRIRSGSKTLRLHDLSIGGCCLVDYDEVLGPSVGTEVQLNLEWCNKVTPVRSRIISRVDHKRHIQFTDLPSEMVPRIRRAMESGVRGSTVRPNLPATFQGPTLEAQEVWISSQGDSLTFRSDLLVRAEFSIQDLLFKVYVEAWPSDKNGKPVDREQLEDILLFLVNIPTPSRLVKELLEDLERMHMQRFA